MLQTLARFPWNGRGLCVVAAGVLLMLPLALTGCVGHHTDLDAASREYLASVIEPEPVNPDESPDAEDAGEDDANDRMDDSAPKPEKMVKLGLRECLELALRHNTDLQVMSLAVPKQQTQIVEAEGIFDTTFFSNNLLRRTDQPSTNLSAPVLGRASTLAPLDEATFEVGLRQVLPTGGQFSISEERGYLKTSNLNYFPKPQYSAIFSVALTHPLLRGFGTDVTMAPIRVASANYQATSWSFEQQVSKFVTDVESAYWTLVSGLEQIRVAEVSLSLAEEVVRREELRLEEGEGTIAELSRARAAVATRESELAGTTTEARNASDDLKRLVNGPDIALEDNTTVVPTDRLLPEALDEEANRSQAMQTALENRPELKGAKAFVKARQVAEAAARNGLLPRLDLELRYDLTGRGKSHTRAWDMQNVGDFADWSMELVFELPIGNRIAKAQHARAQLETSEAAGQLELTRQTIILEVSKAVRGIETLKKQVSATGRAVEAMQKTLEGEQAKLELGVGVIRDVLEAQDDLARVERDYTFAVLNLHLSRLQLDFAKGTVLANRQVEIIHERRKDGYPEPRPRLAAK